MKKTLSLFMAAAMLTCIAGCADSDPSGKNPQIPDGDKTNTANTAWSEDLPVLTFAKAADTVDWIDARDMNNEAKLMLSSLKSVVNSVQPRIYSMEMKEDACNWLSDIGYEESAITEYDDVFELAYKYKDEFSRAVVYDPEVPDTINLASSYAGICGDALVCSPMVLAVLESRGMKPAVVMDFRGKFGGKYDVYEWMYENLWGQLSHKVITCLNYETPGYLRDYAIAAKSAVFWLSTSNAEDVTLLRKFFTDMKAGEAAFMGWFPEGDESSFVSLCSEYGILTYPSDFSENLTFFSGAMKPTPAALAKVPEAVENKVYVAFIVSDGDNLQYHQHKMRTWWNEHNTAPQFPLTWTFNPSAYVIEPAIANWYFTHAGDMNCFMTGPSGLTYNYPRTWKDAAAREKLFALTNKYCSLSGITVVNNWMESSGGYSSLTEAEMAAFGKYYTDLLAVYDQEWLPDGAENVNGLLIDTLTVNYSQVGVGTGPFLAAIDDAIKTLDASQKAQFVTLQGNPWDGSMYNNFKTVYNTFKNEAKVEFVRMDTLAMLERLSLGMSAAR